MHISAKPCLSILPALYFFFTLLPQPSEVGRVIKDVKLGLRRPTWPVDALGLLCHYSLTCSHFYDSRYLLIYSITCFSCECLGSIFHHYDSLTYNSLEQYLFNTWTSNSSIVNHWFIWLSTISSFILNPAWIITMLPVFGNNNPFFLLWYKCLEIAWSSKYIKRKRNKFNTLIILHGGLFSIPKYKIRLIFSNLYKSWCESTITFQYDYNEFAGMKVTVTLLWILQCWKVSTHSHCWFAHKVCFVKTFPSIAF